MKRKSSMLDDYYNDTNRFTGLSYIGNDIEEENPNYICEFCNIELIDKKDDINDPIYGEDKMRKICPSCGTEQLLLN